MSSLPAAEPVYLKLTPDPVFGLLHAPSGAAAAPTLTDS